MPTSTTLLEAVNTLLAMIGDPPVASLTGQLTITATQAQNTITEVSRDVQAEGWHFNTDTALEVSPDNNNNLLVPTNAIKADVNKDHHPASDFVQIGVKFYDRTNHTYIITDAYKCDFVYCRDFDEIPETARRYILMRAGRVFASRQTPSRLVYSFTKEDENMARANLMRDESQTGDLNFLARERGWLYRHRS